jgi:hypothetical protein
MSTTPQVPRTASSLAEWVRRITLRSKSKNLYFADNLVSNGAGVFTTLHTTTLPREPNGYFWKGQGQFVRVTTHGFFAANANSKTYRIYCGSCVCEFVAPVNSGWFRSVCEFWKPTVSSIKGYGMMWTSNGTYPVLYDRDSFTAAGTRVGEVAVVRSEGGNVGASDLNEDFFRVELIPSTDEY